jgi:hypothetical protein
MTSATEHYKQAEEHSARAASWLKDGNPDRAASCAELGRLELDLAKTAALVLGEPCPDPWCNLSAKDTETILHLVSAAYMAHPGGEEGEQLTGLLERLRAGATMPETTAMGRDTEDGQ